MKKIVTLWLAILMVFVLCACGAPTNESPVNTDAQSDNTYEESEKEISTAFSGDLTDYYIDNYCVKVPTIWLTDDGIYIGNDPQYPEGTIKELIWDAENLSYEDLVYVSDNLESIKNSYIGQVTQYFDNWSIIDESEVTINSIKMMREEVDDGDLAITFYWFVDPDIGGTIFERACRYFLQVSEMVPVCISPSLFYWFFTGRTNTMLELTVFSIYPVIVFI